MAHIATCLAAAAPRQPSCHMPSRYQLFPRDRPCAQALDPEKAFAYAMGSNKATSLAPLRLRPSPTRRRKPSIHDPSHMTTVHELPIDSPTIPGRPPLDERSSSLFDDKTGLDPSSDHATGFEMASTATVEPEASASPVVPQPSQSGPLLRSKVSAAKLRSRSIPTLPPARPLVAPNASTPDLSLPASDTTAPTALATPESAPSSAEPRCASPRSWHGRVGHGPAPPYVDDSSTPGAVRGHRRQVSESSTIMGRGRPRKRAGPLGSKVCRDKDKNSPLPAPPEPDERVRDESLERRAFEDLPRGWKPCDALEKLGAGDSASIQRQAYRQAERFEVLGAGDVEALTKEFGQLDERTEYVRRNYAALRAGRRHLHARICQYLRSPRATRFSHKTMLRQEEALAELDDSIDDWVSKLEHVENRRTRVRQKLLEHVAAATMLPVPRSPGAPAESLQPALGPMSPIPGGISTPPESPSRRVFPELPDVGTAPAGEQAPGLKRADVESIRVYVEGDIFALLADVENHITRMSTRRLPASPPGSAAPGCERLCSADGSTRDPGSPATDGGAGLGPRLPPLKTTDLVLSSAVFKP